MALKTNEWYGRQDKPKGLEVRHTDGNQVEVIHGESPNRVLTFSPDEWNQFLDGVKSGEFDLNEA